MGATVCATCDTPLTYRYLWATGEKAVRIEPGTQVAGRYYVVAPQIWLDVQPGLPPDFPATDLPDEMLPYLYLYPCRLHVPEVYGISPVESGDETSGIFLLENVPLEPPGILQPAIAQVWADASATRQVYWLWQMLQLWASFQEQGVAASLLVPENLRVEGWRLRLCQLIRDAEVLPAMATGEETIALSLADLANLWLEWIKDARPELVEPLQSLCRLMRTSPNNQRAIATQLNQLLLEQAAQLPLRLQVAGATDSGPQHNHNEDTCYPLTTVAGFIPDGLSPHLAIVCDGIGGHEGGEVASQLAVQSIKLQAQAMLSEVVQQEELVTPDILAEQLAATVRVVNNLITAQNDAQGREARRRMGTTLMMALQIPQQVQPGGVVMPANGHEVYLASVGDSRAYWITPRYCQCLTIDDDVAAREVRLGRSPYREALQRADSGALTQALGMRDAEFLRPFVQRFIIEEDGVLLLCSDGLSDQHQVEASWQQVMDPLFKGQRSLTDTAQDWVNLANQKNGHDNASVVLMQCQVSLTQLALPSFSSPVVTPHVEPELMPAAATLPTSPATTVPSPRKPILQLAMGSLAALLLGATGLAIWSQVDAVGFQQFRQQVWPTAPKP